jgi:DNA replication regulator DPB11
VEMYEAIDVEVGQTQESMRVMYEDPGQMDQRKRLMNIFGSQRTQDEGVDVRKSKQRSVRRSSRVAGF